MPTSFDELFLICLQLSVASFAVQVHVAAPSNPSLTSGPRSEAGLEFEVVVPEGRGPFPVVILLHGGVLIPLDAKGMMDKIRGNLGEFAGAMEGMASTHIQVAPIGLHGWWNVGAEPTERDDTALIGTNLTEYLLGFSNVRPEFKLIGVSNGAGLVNRILIENDNPLITVAVTCLSQLNQQQWHDGSFYIGGRNNSYKARKKKVTKRRVLQLVAGRDVVVPPGGGVSIITMGGAHLAFLSWEESIFRLAQAYGHTGLQAGIVQHGPRLAYVSYMQGQVKGYMYKNLSHDHHELYASGKEIESFLLDGGSS